MTETIWISHRGFCEDGATENTRAAFDSAIALGFTHLETDLRLTRDSVIVLHHDDELERTFAQSARISELTHSELMAFRTKDGQAILSLDELYTLYDSYHWTFDVKTPCDRDTLKALSLWASSESRRKWLATHVRFLFWNSAAETDAGQLFPSTPCLARERACYRAGLAVLIGLPFLGGILRGKTYSVSPSFRGLSLFESRILGAYQKRGASLLAYLPASEVLAKKAKNLGFDEILTNGRKYL